jgi:hypothetical protein
MGAWRGHIILTYAPRLNYKMHIYLTDMGGIGGIEIIVIIVINYYKVSYILFIYIVLAK